MQFMNRFWRASYCFDMPCIPRRVAGVCDNWYENVCVLGEVYMDTTGVVFTAYVADFEVYGILESSMWEFYK